MKQEIKTVEELIRIKLKSKEKLPFKTMVVNYPKGAIIIGPKMIEKNLYFVSSGIVKTSAISKTGIETIFAIYFQSEILSSLSSFISQKPTEFTISCVTDCVLELIPRDDLYEAMKHSILANDLYRYYFEFTYLLRLKKEKDSLTKSALERYNELIVKHPEIIKFFPVKTIASYLNIHPKSLSRLKKIH